MRRVLVSFALLLVAACDVPLQHGMDENSANEVVIALERANIRASKTRDEAAGAEGGYQVSVGGSDSARAMELLRSLGLPRSRRSGLAEMYAQPSLVPTATEERARFVEALGNDVERTLETIDGVVSARVHITLAESDPLSADAKPRVPAQASVLIKTKAGPLLTLKDTEVQKIVAGAVPGLAPAAVAVVVTVAPEYAGGVAAPMTTFGPIRVAPGSRLVLASAFAALLGLVAILAMVLLFTARRLAAVQRARR
jgi:type III secretion protein J